MALSNDLISQFVKITNDATRSKKETIVYGTTVEYKGSMYVNIDGSDLLTPISTTADMKAGERVTVMIKNHNAIVTGNVTSPSASRTSVNNLSDQVSKIVASEVTAEQLNVQIGRIDTLYANNATITGTLDVNTADIEYLKANLITGGNLEVVNGKITNLESEVGNINTLIFGSASGDIIQTSFSNAVIGQLGDAQIKSAMIDSVSASKITAGDIVTNNVRVKSQNGLLLISDETIQISDNTRARVQIGKDASNDYSINVWDAEGNLMFSKGGITDSAIKQAIIRDDMVSDNANIAAHKLDIDSLFDEINGSSKTIKSSKVYLDEEGQTLDVVFKSLETTVTSHGETISSMGTSILTMQGQIESKIWQQDINTATGEMSTKYSTLTQTANDIVARLNNQKIGGTNILRGTNTVTSLPSSSSWANSTWRAAGGGTGTRTVIDISDAPNANIKKGFRIVGDNTDTNTAQDNVPVAIGEEYTLSCYARGTGTLRLQVGKSPYSATHFTMDDVSEWTKYSFTFVAGTGNGVTNGSTNVYVGNRGVGTMEMCGIKLEVGNTTTDWNMSPYDVDIGINNAAKTATNYLSFSTAGLVIGDMTASTLGKNILIDSDSVDIRSGTSVRASFGEDYLYLAKHSKTATIDMCNGLAKLYHAMDGSDSLFVIDTTNYNLSSAKVLSSRWIPLTIETTAANTDNVIVKSIINGVTVGAFGMNSDGYMVRYGSEIAGNVVTTNPPVILDTANFAEKMDSSWVNCTLNSGAFTRYNNDIPQPQVRKIGKQVYLRGEAKPVTAVTPESDSDTVIATIPSGYRPSERQQFVMQGSGSYRWMMSIHTDGRIAISRYSNSTTANMNIAAGAWLCCHAQWLVD